MESIRINNLRCLKDTEWIDLKKVNVLVGNNSSGKSTFLRVFPLFKQTFNKKITGPILWCGDESDYVDFGSFEEAVFKGDKEDQISFSFKFRLTNIVNVYRAFSSSRTEDKWNTTLGISITNNGTVDYISSLIIEVEDKKIEFFFDQQGQIDEVFIDDIKLNTAFYKESDFYRMIYEQTLFDIDIYSIRQVATKKIIEMLHIDETKDFSLVYIDDLAGTVFYKQFDRKMKLSRDSQSNIKKILDSSSYDENALNRWTFLYCIYDVYISITRYLSVYFGRTYYIAPVRATAERYYRLRNLAINEVDCRGKNLAVFLNGLSVREFSNFKKWTKENLGFSVGKETDRGHVSILIEKDGLNNSVNLSDTGFGYSQILPIVTQIWYIASHKEDTTGLTFGPLEDIPATIVIEQPALHLHPALQAKLIDIMIKVSHTCNIRFVIETHSETIVNRIGLAIFEKKILAEDVGVIVFQKEFGEEKTTLKKCDYDEDGYLKDWPIGFFDPE